MYTMRTTPFKVALLLTSIVITVSATIPTQNKYKNLKILPKNITEKELDKIMEDFEKALGVECNYCHVKKADELDYVSDNKPEKEIGRKMMTMTTDINKRYFDFNKKANSIQAVTCYTCHKGTPIPEKEINPVKEKD
jgi:hypothetical protein